MIVNRPDAEYEFHIGDRVVFVRDDYHGGPIAAGTLGTIEAMTSAQGTPYLSRVSHATSNGGGHDVPVRLDDGRRVIVRAEGRTQYMRKATPMDEPCTYCGVEPGEPCNPDCLSDVTRSEEVTP